MPRLITLTCPSHPSLPRHPPLIPEIISPANSLDLAKNNRRLFVPISSNASRDFLRSLIRRAIISERLASPRRPDSAPRVRSHSNPPSAALISLAMQ